MTDRSRRPLAARLANSVGQALVRLVDDGEGGQMLQLELLADEVMEGVERHQDYGFTSVPHPGSTAITLALGGTRGRSMAVGVGDRRYRLTGLAAGEVAIHDDQGQKVHLTRDGIVIHTAKSIQITAGEAVTITAPSLTAEIEGAVQINCATFDVAASGAATVQGAQITLRSDEVNLGGPGGERVARKTDAVTGGVITGGSMKVKST